MNDYYKTGFFVMTGNTKLTGVCIIFKIILLQFMLLIFTCTILRSNTIERHINFVVIITIWEYIECNLISLQRSQIKQNRSILIHFECFDCSRVATSSVPLIRIIQ